MVAAWTPSPHSRDRSRLSHRLHRRRRIVRTAPLCLDRNRGRSVPTRRTPPAYPSPTTTPDDPRFDDGVDAYPANPIKAIAEKPGAGGTVNILNRAYFPPPTPFEQNPTWQEVNRQINAIPGRRDRHHSRSAP